MVQTLSSIPSDAVSGFTAGLSGAVLKPGSDEYDQARKVFNGMVDRRPGLIAQPATTADVQSCVKFAREHDLLVSVNGGGHSVQGYGVCDGGLMVDFKKMKAITVDPDKRTALAEAGVTWGELDAATQAHGLAVTGGRIPSTGIAGLTLGSGSGWLERKFGFTVDNMIGAEVVTANGDVLHASESENDDLFWGLRGGGGNFGIVTRFEYRLYPLGPIVYGGMLGFPRDPAILRAYRDFMENAPDEVCGAAALVTAPHLDFVPEPVRGMPVMAVVVLYAGDAGDGPAAFKPILDLDPVLNMTAPMPYTAVQQLLEPMNPHGVRNYWKADFYPELPDEAIDKLLSEPVAPSPMTSVIIMPNGGAVHRVPEGATALGWRSAKWSLHLLSLWEDTASDDQNIEWTRNLSQAMRPWAQEAAYLNYLMDEGEQRVKDSFGSHYERMVTLKNKYDPTNFFRLNQNIKPTA